MYCLILCIQIMVHSSTYCVYAVTNTSFYNNNRYICSILCLVVTNTNFAFNNNKWYM